MKKYGERMGKVLIDNRLYFDKIIRKVRKDRMGRRLGVAQFGGRAVRVSRVLKTYWTPVDGEVFSEAIVPVASN